MSRNLVCAVLVCVALSFEAPAASFADCPPYASSFYSTSGPAIRLVGGNGFDPDTFGVYTVRVKSGFNSPLSGVNVVIEWTTGNYPYHVCANQTYPNMTYSQVGSTQRFTAPTDANGVAKFCITGYGSITSCTSYPFQQAKILVCGQELTSPFDRVTVATPNIYGIDGSGIDGNDLSVFLADYSCNDGPPNNYTARSDFDGDHEVGGLDLSLFLAIYLAGGSVAACPNY